MFGSSRSIDKCDGILGQIILNTAFIPCFKRDETYLGIDSCVYHATINVQSHILTEFRSSPLAREYQFLAHLNLNFPSHFPVSKIT